MYLVAGGALTGSQAAKQIKPDDINGVLTWKRKTFLATERGRLRVHEFVLVIFNEFLRVRFAGKAVLDGVLAEYFANWNRTVFVRRWIGSLLVDNIPHVVSPLQLRATEPEGASLPPLHLILYMIWSNVVVIRGRR